MCLITKYSIIRKDLTRVYTKKAMQAPGNKLQTWTLARGKDCCFLNCEGHTSTSRACWRIVQHVLLQELLSCTPLTSSGVSRVCPGKSNSFFTRCCFAAALVAAAFSVLTAELFFAAAPAALFAGCFSGLMSFCCLAAAWPFAAAFLAPASLLLLLAAGLLSFASASLFWEA